MKYLAALAAIVLPASAQAVSQPPAEGEVVYECQITEICKTSGCAPIDPARTVTLKRVDGNSKGRVLADGEEFEVHVFRGVGSQEFLRILSGGSVGYTVSKPSGALAIRASGAQQRHERGQCAIAN